MKRFLMFLLASVFVFSLLLPVVGETGATPLSTDAKKEQTVDLSKYRKTFITEDNQSYKSTEEKQLPFDALTALSVSANTSKNEDLSLVFDKTKNVPVIKLSNVDSLKIKLKTRNVKEKDSVGGDYKLSSDSYGETQSGNNRPYLTATNNTIVETGRIGTGALIVQKSFDGKDYEQSKLEKFSNEKYTTDYLKYFSNSNECIFTSKGDDLKKGVYLSINFYYEVAKYSHTRKFYTNGQIAFMAISQWGLIIELARGPQGREDIYEYSNMRESYTFYLIEDNVENITFNNLSSLSTNIETPQNGDFKNDFYNSFLSTMYDGDMTISGFRINVTANPHIMEYPNAISLKCNNMPIPLPKLIEEKVGEKYQKYYEITQRGKYEITISSYSKKKTVTLYVDNVDSEVAYERYFGKSAITNGQVYGDEFLDYSPNNMYGNIRVYNQSSKVPVFKNSVTFHLQKINEMYDLPLYGVIVNKTTGEIQDIEQSQFTITKNGDYQIMLYTNKNYYQYVVLGKSNPEISGDVRVYTFNLKLINGQSSLPSVNHQILLNGNFDDLSFVSPSDYIPAFYGVTRPSLNKGKITIAFADELAALNYAKSLVWSEIEEYTNDDGTTYWKIPDINNPLGQKVTSHSGWENARIVNELAKLMVQKCYFDMTEKTTFLTLNKCVDELTEESIDFNSFNLSGLSLEKSIVIWFDKDQRNLARINLEKQNETEIIKYIGKQSVAILSQDSDGSYSIIKEEIFDFKFIKDDYGFSSFQVLAIDSDGQEFLLNYEEGLYEQLMSNNFKSGPIKIVEKSVYGEEIDSYYIYFIQDGHQPAVLNLTYKEKEFSLSSQGHIIVDETINVDSLDNFIDPYTIVKICYFTDETNCSIDYYSLEEIKNIEFSSKGKYEIFAIDHFGNYACYYVTIL